MADDSQQASGPGSDWGLRVLGNEHLRVEVLTGLGGKLSSISLAGSGGELLQSALKPYAPRTATEPFDQSDGSGWDECLPSIGPCKIAYGEGKTADVQDHGDFWRIAFTVDESTETTLRMHADGTSLPLRFERTLQLEGGKLHLHYAVTNTSDARVPYGWSTHPLFAIFPYDRIVLPPSVTEIKAEASANGRLGAAGSSHPWPHTVNALDGEPLDLSLVLDPLAGVGDKLVIPAPAEGWAAIERKTLRTRLTLHYDAAEAPVLGLWLCYGGWPNDPAAKKGYAASLEPCNLPVDSLAASLGEGGGTYLQAGETTHWRLRLEVERVEER